jgi:hypothetical protein
MDMDDFDTVTYAATSSNPARFAAHIPAVVKEQMPCFWELS